MSGFPNTPSIGNTHTIGAFTWEWDGVAWVGVAGTGLQGTTGLQGLQGTQGLQGAQGTAGSGGANLQGLQGLQGIQGNQGTTGTGSQGLQGLQGNQGTTGTGSQGLQGLQGLQGNQGTTGTGSQGLQGLQGLQGRQGTTGTGSQGLQGLQGNQGTSGTGSQGLQGLQGIQGTTGTGLQGIQGSYGFNGGIFSEYYATDGITCAPGENGIFFFNVCTNGCTANCIADFNAGNVKILYISKSDYFGADLSGYFDSLISETLNIGTGYWFIRYHNSDPNEANYCLVFNCEEFSSATIDGFQYLVVKGVEGSGNRGIISGGLPTNGKVYSLTYYPN